MNERAREWRRKLAQLSEWEMAHAERVAVYAVAVGYALGWRDQALQQLRIAAELHDVGKLEGVGRHGHPHRGGELLEPDFPDEVVQMVRDHHERQDGSGYPLGLAGDELAPGSQIIGMVEHFDVALYGAPFAEGRTRDAIFAELEAHFAPELVQALRSVEPLIQPIGT